jgi:hypothetical protein
MDAIEYIIYTILTLVLIAFIGVIAYIIYDNYTYKNNLTSDLNTNFKDINNNFNSTSNTINDMRDEHVSNINRLSSNLNNTSNLFTTNISDINYKIIDNSNVFASNISDINYKITGNSNLFTNNIGTFSQNLNKYFSFNNNLNTAYNDANNKIFEYRTTDTNGSKLDLITKTTATAGLKINSDANKELEICNSTGTKCFNIYSDNDGLYIGANARSSNIYIGGNKTTAPMRIENGIVNVGLDNSNYTRDTSVSMKELIIETSNKIMTDMNAVKDKQELIISKNSLVLV